MLSTTRQRAESVDDLRSERWRPLLRGALVAARLAGAALLGASAAVHLHLWLDGYRHIPTIGPLFLAQAVVGFVLTAVLVFTPRPIVALGAIAFLLSTVGGLLLSATVGIFGFHDGLDAPYAGLSLVLECLAVVLLAVAAWGHHVEFRRRGRSVPDRP